MVASVVAVIGSTPSLITSTSSNDFAEGDAAKAAHHDVLAKAGVVGLYVVTDGLVGVFDEWLVEQTALGKVLHDLAFDDFVDHLWLFAIGQSLFAELSGNALFFLGWDFII